MILHPCSVSLKPSEVAILTQLRSFSRKNRFFFYRKTSWGWIWTLHSPPSAAPVGPSWLLLACGGHEWVSKEIDKQRWRSWSGQTDRQQVGRSEKPRPERSFPLFLPQAAVFLLRVHFFPKRSIKMAAVRQTSRGFSSLNLSAQRIKTTVVYA